MIVFDPMLRLAAIATEPPDWMNSAPATSAEVGTIAPEAIAAQGIVPLLIWVRPLI